MEEETVCVFGSDLSQTLSNEDDGSNNTLPRSPLYRGWIVGGSQCLHRPRGRPAHGPEPAVTATASASAGPDHPPQGSPNHPRRWSGRIVVDIEAFLVLAIVGAESTEQWQLGCGGEGGRPFRSLSYRPANRASVGGVCLPLHVGRSFLCRCCCCRNREGSERSRRRTCPAKSQASVQTTKTIVSVTQSRIALHIVQCHGIVGGIQCTRWQTQRNGSLTRPC